MQDRYLFRAKRLDNGQWVQGFICKKKYKSNKFYISCFHDKDDNEQFFAIDPDTICQCTGLKDKNGKLIWENDIVKVHEDEEPCLIEGGEDTARWHMTQYGSYIYDFDNYWSYEVEVIGSAIDNPELLEVGE